MEHRQLIVIKYMLHPFVLLKGMTHAYDGAKYFQHINSLDLLNNLMKHTL